MTSELSSLLKNFNENNVTEEQEDQLCAILLLDIYDVYDTRLQSLLKTYIKKIINDCNSYEESCRYRT